MSQIKIASPHKGGRLRGAKCRAAAGHRVAAGSGSLGNPATCFRRIWLEAADRLKKGPPCFADSASGAVDGEGFTLIELMVVVLIMGILMAIAIPTFLSTRGSANDASSKSDATNAFTNEKSYYASNQAFVSAGTITGEPVRPPPPPTWTIRCPGATPPRARRNRLRLRHRRCRRRDRGLLQVRRLLLHPGHGGRQLLVRRLPGDLGTLAWALPAPLSPRAGPVSAPPLSHGVEATLGRTWASSWYASF